MILQCDHYGASYLLAVDKQTGENRWKLDRPGVWHSWSSPQVAAADGHRDHDRRADGHAGIPRRVGVQAHGVEPEASGRAGQEPGEEEGDGDGEHEVHVEVIGIPANGLLGVLAAVGDVVDALARIEVLRVEPDSPAVVVIDEASGTIVMGANVRISTVAIAQEHGAEVRHFEWADDFSAARNAALAHCTGRAPSTSVRTRGSMPTR